MCCVVCLFDLASSFFHLSFKNMYNDIISDDTGPCQLMICTCSHIPVYCVYQNTHTLLPSPPLLSSSQEQRSIPLHIAALNEEYNVIPLHIAAYNGHLDTVKRLVEGGSNIDHQNKVRTLEHVSCDQVYGNIEMLTS